MSTPVTFNGASYNVPIVGERQWGANVSNLLISLAGNALSKAGGPFVLTAAEINFGTNYGIVAKYIKSASNNIAASGVIRFSNYEGLSWRSGDNAFDLDLVVDNNNRLLFGGSQMPTGSSVDLFSNKTLDNLFYTSATASVISTNLAPSSSPYKSIQRITSSSANLATINNPGSTNIGMVLFNATGSTISVLNDSGASPNSILTGTGAAISLPADASLLVIYDYTSSRWKVIGGSGGGSSSSTLQTLTGTQTVANYLKKLTPIHTENANANQAAATFAHGITAFSNAYRGGCYSPTQNRIYLAPNLQGNQTNWHYIDCATGSVVAYAHGITAVSEAYMGGVYSPTQNRIYLVPFAQANQTNWHYIDCATGSVVAYAHGITAVLGAYQGGVYSPTQNRIYLVPNYQSNSTNWHYINCATGAVVAYAHGITAVQYAYQGGVYSPTQDRIYLVPTLQSNQTNWHYINCATGSVVAYAHGITAVASAYSGGAYSPTQDRIYLVPASQANQTNWHYIDCATGSVVAYANGVSAASGAYEGGIYSPTQNRIYLVPYAQSSSATWHYINCTTGSVVAYSHGVTAGSFAYSGGAYSPTQNRIYLAPNAQSNQTNWHFIASTAEASFAPHYFGSTILSSTF